MSAWTRIRPTLARQARMAVQIAPAILAAARAVQAAHRGDHDTLHLGRTSITLSHDDRYRGYVALALLGGAVLGGAATLLTAPRAGAETRSRFRDRIERWWPPLDRVPRAWTAARHAATSAFRDAYFDTTRTPTV